MNRLTIKSGWYWSAGIKYGWKKDGVNPQGIGISKEMLQKNKELIVEVDHQEYTLDCERARAFVNKYQSAQTMPGGTIIGIISRDLLEKI